MPAAVERTQHWLDNWDYRGRLSFAPAVKQRSDGCRLDNIVCSEDYPERLLDGLKQVTHIIADQLEPFFFD